MGADCWGPPPCEVTLLILLPQMRKLRLREGSGSTEASHQDTVPGCGGGDICVCCEGWGVGTAGKRPLPGHSNLFLGGMKRWVVAGPRASPCL